MKKWFVLIGFVLSFNLLSNDIQFNSQLTQDEFSTFITELGSSIHFNPATPAEKLTTPSGTRSIGS